MVVKYNYGEIGPGVAMKIKEGDLTVSEISTPHGTQVGATFQYPAKKGDIVALAGDLLVEKLRSGVTGKPIGVIEDEPQFQGQPPSSNATDGNYPRRIAAVKLFGVAVREMKLAASNAAVTAGDYIKISSDGQRIDKSAEDPTDKIALKSASANSGAEIPVLIGYYYK